LITIAFYNKQCPWVRICRPLFWSQQMAAAAIVAFESPSLRGRVNPMVCRCSRPVRFGRFGCLYPIAETNCRIVQTKNLTLDYTSKKSGLSKSTGLELFLLLFRNNKIDIIWRIWPSKHANIRQLLIKPYFVQLLMIKIPKLILYRKIWDKSIRVER
jgi:hypothetical protein